MGIASVFHNVATEGAGMGNGGRLVREITLRALSETSIERMQLITSRNMSRTLGILKRNSLFNLQMYQSLKHLKQLYTIRMIYLNY